MISRRVLRVVVGMASAALLLSACGGSSSDDAGVAPLQTSFEKLPALEATTGEPGETLDAGSGISISVSEARVLEVSDAVTGVDNVTDLGTVNAVDITVSNGSDAAYSPFAMTVQVLGADGVTPCTDIFDDVAGVSGTPFDDIPVGESVTFAWGFSCGGAPGEPVTVRVLLDAEGTPLDVTTTLAG